MIDLSDRFVCRIGAQNCAAHVPWHNLCQREREDGDDGKRYNHQPEASRDEAGHMQVILVTPILLSNAAPDRVRCRIALGQAAVTCFRSQSAVLVFGSPWTDLRTGLIPFCQYASASGVSSF